MSDEGDNFNHKLAKFMLIYRKTPQSTTTEAPAMHAIDEEDA